MLGCYDSRITLYSQQVRALELAHALHRTHYVAADAHVAVVGGGAGGLTMAAALALQGTATVHLFQRGPDLMPLQSAATRRRLDPHIYGWPTPGAEQVAAELPILDWTSGSAVEVRRALVREFDEVRAAVGDRLLVHTGHRVTRVTASGATFEVDFDADDPTGGLAPGARIVDLLVLAIGFGLERRQPIRGVQSESYWRDAGVPGGDIEGRGRPSVLVSGNGDGGLIDLIAAASRDFDHDVMIRTITRRPGVDRLSAPLATIDERARAADAAGQGFDFVAAYDVEVGPIADNLGLTDEMAGRLLPGVQLHLQTREPELMSIRTATLNRLAVYLVRRACGRSPRENFEHVVCTELDAVEPRPDHDAPAYALTCDGRRLEVDRLVVRRGPNRDFERQPFADLLRDYPDAHEAWMRRFPAEAIAPVLGRDARAHFEDLTRAHRLPSPGHRRAAEAAGAARRIKVALHGGEARWTGDVPLAGAATAWDAAGPPVTITVPAIPADLGALAYALGRLALHAQGGVMHVDVARWGAFLDGITTASRNAEDLDRPTLRPVDGSSDLAPERLTTDNMAARLGATLDRRCLAMIDEHLAGLLERGEDPGHVVDLAPAPEVAAAMRAIWAEWKAAFDRDPALLARFLRLLVCAQDGTAAADEARTLVGPRKRKLLVRATGAALAVATGWASTAPHPDEPGNLTHQTGAHARTGHVCAAERIGGRTTATEAASFLWRTDFVVLPMLTSPVAVARRAEERFDATDESEPTFAKAGAGPSLMLSVDPRFKAGVAAGLAQIAGLLSEAEAAHAARLGSGIERNVGGGRDLEEAA
ncbi:ABC-three component system protein [Muricoccus pecuniae]|uniref:ABC-three component systems C-terminal domain-containing protein n=1 Tax=Muricoccus pecuniae TaxID=693023 RepID=A0A840Y5C5_9PROT|nr:ABC-three component system protein [Roseomonas pecuniae]MBB5695945.1 hypothetical protein [Roseomonas pecuniae]